MAAELVELGGTQAKDAGARVINTPDVVVAIQCDQEIKGTFEALFPYRCDCVDCAVLRVKIIAGAAPNFKNLKPTALLLCSWF